MAKDDLFDLMLDDHAQQPAQPRSAPEPKRSAVPKVHLNATEQAIARQLEIDRQAGRQAEVEARPAAEMRAVERAADAPTELQGFRVGHRFEMSRCAPEINGIWAVVQIDPGAAGDPSRRLFAKRPEGGAGVLPLTENKLRDALHNRILKRL